MQSATSNSVAPGRRTMASLLADRIREDVLSGSLRPGSRLTMRDLTERYDAGAIPLREALSRLSTTGFITAEDQRGFRVADISAEEVLDIHTQRAELESMALRESIRVGTVQWEADLVAAHHAMVRMQSKLSGRPLASNAEWEALHVQFHLRLVGASTSKWLQHFIRTLIEHSSRYRQVGSHIIAGTPPKRDVAAEHQAILDAALARDADLACALLKAHYRATADIVVGMIDNSAKEKTKARTRRPSR